MNIHNKISIWNDRFPVLFVILRIILGLILTIRGIYFLNAIKPLVYSFKEGSLIEPGMNTPLALLFCWVHILGGTFIILGLLTKISVWAQMPFVLTAIFILGLNNGLSRNYPYLLLEVFVLFLLILIAFSGGGEISMDNYVKKHLL